LAKHAAQPLPHAAAQARAQEGARRPQAQVTGQQEGGQRRGVRGVGRQDGCHRRRRRGLWQRHAAHAAPDGAEEGEGEGEEGAAIVEALFLLAGRKADACDAC
jgi:hypothetical protein